MSYMGSCCGLEAGMNAGEADTSPCPSILNVPQLIAELDGLYAQGRESEAQEKLESWHNIAKQGGDWRSQLSMVSELLGQYRRSMDEEKGLAAVEEALALIGEHRMGKTVSGATVLLNTATTLKCFGEAERALPVFSQVCRVYSASLDPGDYRMGGLYNNMALAQDDAGDHQGAMKYFAMALRVMEGCPGTENDRAVTFCNMAEACHKQDAEDPRIAEYLEAAWENLNAPGLARDGYHAFTISKCRSSFDYLGYFLYARELKEREEKIYAGNR